MIPPMKRKSKQTASIRPQAIRPLRRFERDLNVERKGNEIPAESGGAKGEQAGDINADGGLTVRPGVRIDRGRSNESGE